ILRYKMGMDARRKCVEEFSWDKNAEIWMEWIDGLPDKSHLWNSPARLFSPNTNIPQIPHNDDFIRWCIINIAGRPDLLDGYMHMVMLRDLNQGMSQEFYGGMVVNEDAAIGSKTRQVPFDRNSVVQKLLNMRNKINQWEMRRCQM